VLIYWKIIAQSIRLSFEEIVSSKLRSFLSLLGISIGVLCVVSVTTAVTSLEKNIQNSFASFGTDILYIQKWPWIWADDNDYPWWRFLNRPNVNDRELAQLENAMNTPDAVALINFTDRKTVKFADKFVENVNVTGATKDYNLIKNLDFVAGRYFTQGEFKSGSHICLIGANVSDALFDSPKSAEGKRIRVGGVELRVAGVLKREGDDLFGFTLDNSLVIPYNTLPLFSSANSSSDPLIALKPKDGIPFDEMKYEAKGAMRAIRRLAPNQDDNFALNKMSVFTDGISSILAFVSFAGFIIGGFSMLVGGFGIANIMFVSVKERTNIIGIKKALGAKQIYILLEFLLEAIILCLLGGLIGLLLMFSLIKSLEWYLITYQESTFIFYITFKNIMTGFILSFIIGVISGFIPAWQASRMKPVDAIRG
jgi:putative ABC transport system permease protein